MAVSYPADIRLAISLNITWNSYAPLLTTHQVSLSMAVSYPADISSVVDPKLFITDPDPDPTFQWVLDPDPDPTCKKFGFRNRPFSWSKYDFKGPKMAFQNIIFKEY
jgi:hypothetical protein